MASSSPPTAAVPPLPPLRIGTRRSNLAVVQAEGIRDSLQKLVPERSFEIVALRTLGDKDQSKALYSFGAKSLWTTELEEKLTSGELDVIVHCLKDMPTSLPDTCELAAIPPRDDPRDALVVRAGLPPHVNSLQSLPPGAVVGTSSVRRAAQLLRLRPDLRPANLRGNVETRLAKVDDPACGYDCMIVSAAGLERVGLGSRIAQRLGTAAAAADGGGREEGSRMLHAAGQGALGLEIRRGDAAMRELLRGLADAGSTLACLAERALLRALEGGCSVPIGVETEWVGRPGDSVLRMRAVVVGLDGSEAVEDAMDAVVRNEEAAAALGQRLAAQMVKAGADVILNEINAKRPAKE